MRIDLHTHSTVSDGTESPSEVIRAAAAAKIDTVALTDHDSVSGWQAASAMAAALGLGFVPGVEVSAKHRGISIHLLGYWPDPHAQAMTDMFAKTRRARVARAQEMTERIAKQYPITWDDVMVRAGDADTVGRPHIADALIDAGHFEDRSAAFAAALMPGSPFYVPHYAPDVLDAVRAVRAAGGVPVFAHPGADLRGRVVADQVIVDMADAGLAGLEIDHRDHSPQQRERLSALAERLGLIRTGSSDYHGAGKPNQLGENTTSEEAFDALHAQRG